MFERPPLEKFPWELGRAAVKTKFLMLVGIVGVKLAFLRVITA
jgi:hypothetical protein